MKNFNHQYATNAVDKAEEEINDYLLKLLEQHNIVTTLDIMNLTMEYKYDSMAKYGVTLVIRNKFGGVIIEMTRILMVDPNNMDKPEGYKCEYIEHDINLPF